MRIEILPVAEEGYWLRIDTPSQPCTELDIQQFFRECKWNLLWQEEQGQGIQGIAIMLNSADELAATSTTPSSPFLEALCQFLTEHPFVVERGQHHHEPLRLAVGLSRTRPHNENAADNDDDDEMLAAATSRICCAMFQNETIRRTHYIVVNIPFVPSQELVNLLVAEKGNSGGNDDNDFGFDFDLFDLMPTMPLLTTDSVNQHVTIITRNRAREASSRNILQVEVADSVCLCSVGAEYAAPLMDRVLNAFDGPNTRRRSWRAKIIVESDLVANAVASSLREHGMTRRRRQAAAAAALEAIRLVAATPENLHEWLPSVDHFTSPYLDGTRLYRAAMSISSVTQLFIAGFLLSKVHSSLDEAAIETEGRYPPDVARLYKLVIEDCVLQDDPVCGPDALVTSLVPQTRSLNNLDLRGTRLSTLAVAALCRILADGSVIYVELGRNFREIDDGDCLDDDAVAHLFRSLPTLKSLRSLTVNHNVPTHLFRTVVDGVKDNYWIEQVWVHWFADDGSEEAAPSPGETIRCYLHANSDGRRASVYAAAMAMQGGASTTAVARHLPCSDDLNSLTQKNLDTKVGSALRTLEDFVNEGEDMFAITSRYLCVRMFVPAALGGTRSRGQCFGPASCEPMIGSSAAVAGEEES